MFRIQRVISASIALAIALTALALVLPTDVRAADDGVIWGTVRNGTAGQPIPAGVTVTLSRFEGQTPVEDISITTDSTGAYRFEGLPTEDGIAFATSVRYLDVLYPSAMIRLSEVPEQQADITIFETTTDQSAITLQSRGFVLSGIDDESGTVTVLDVFALTNTGDRTVVPDDEGRTLRFSVPANARSVDPAPGMNLGIPSIEGSIVFATAPLPPGEASVSLNYVIPYENSSVSLEVNAEYPTDGLRILVPSEGDGFSDEILVSGAGLTDTGIVAVGDRDYHVWISGAVEQGQPIAVTFEQLPRFDPPREQLRTLEPALIAFVAVVLAAAATIWIVAKRELHKPRPVVVAPALAIPLTERREELAEQLRRLEDDHQHLRVDDTAYAVERRAILEQLRQISRQMRGLGSDE